MCVAIRPFFFGEKREGVAVAANSTDSIVELGTTVWAASLLMAIMRIAAADTLRRTG